MYKKLRQFANLLICLCLSSNLYAADKEAPGMPGNLSLSPVLKKTMPAIVNVAVQGVMPDTIVLSEDKGHGQMNPNQLRPKPKPFQSLGSGVIVDAKNGVIITNDHVIRNANVITITLQDGRRLKAKMIGGDPETDLAVLKIDAKNLHSLPIGNSDKLEVGDFVVAIGNPFGLNSFGNSQTATFGIISALKRSALNIEGVENFIQTDAAINPGNSGGALINTKGQLIGINTAIISPYGGNVGIGFAIPINMAKEVAEQIIKYGSVHRGLMGIFVQHLSPEIAQAMGYDANTLGALVTQVNENSPAEKAGLKSGDIIIQINDTKITQATQVKTTISLLRVGSPVKIMALRNGKKVSLQGYVTDLKKHEQKLQSSNPFLYGLALRNFEENSPMHGQIKGIQVVGASENSTGWRAGIRPGDVIVSANQKSTTTIAELQNISQHAKEQLLVKVLRGAGSLFLLIQ
jgi:serine protease Do